jgi:hypothetical protein
MYPVMSAILDYREDASFFSAFRAFALAQRACTALRVISDRFSAGTSAHRALPPSLAISSTVIGFFRFTRGIGSPLRLHFTRRLVWRQTGLLTVRACSYIIRAGTKEQK